MLKPKVKSAQIERRIADAIKRMANLDAKQITVTATDGTVHLQGRVHSWYEKRLAEQEAASAPGVSKVDNQITVVPA
jgi:osmotically-inducible protein OsmY